MLPNFEPDHDYWDSAYIDVNRPGNPVLVTLYKAPEWADYRWEFTRRLTWQCAQALIRHGFVEPHPLLESIYVLSKKGEAENALRK